MIEVALFIPHTRCQLRESIHTPSNKPVGLGHDLTRHSLVRLTRIRTGNGRIKCKMNQICRHQHRVSEALQARLHNTWPASVHYTIVTYTWWCWTLQHANGLTTCNVTYLIEHHQSNARRRILSFIVVVQPNIDIKF